MVYIFMLNDFYVTEIFSKKMQSKADMSGKTKLIRQPNVFAGSSLLCGVLTALFKGSNIW